MLTLVKSRPGINVPEFSKELDIPSKTLERWLKQLKDQKLVEHRGSRKTGGYHIAENKF